MTRPAAMDLDPDERAAVRAYLQRSEVRLSTIHRVATALLSGAGLMVLLPIVGRDAVVEVLRHLFTGTIDAPKGLLVVSILLALSVPLASLMMVLRDLTEFYFHANHVEHDGVGTFTPRFTLTALRIPEGELGVVATEQLTAERTSARTVELLVPDNDAARARMDARIAAYGGLGVDRRGDLGQLDENAEPPSGEADAPRIRTSSKASDGDLARAEAMFVLAASRERSMLEEVAKVEHGLVRHVLRIQMIVLRYVKALLALLTTALAVFGAAAVVDGKTTLGSADDAWLAAILLLWAPVAIAAVSMPVRWLERMLRNEGAATSAVGQDQALTQVEDVTVRIAMGGYLAALVAMVVSLTDGEIATAGKALGIGVVAATVVALVFTLRIWGEGSMWQRFAARG